MADKQSRLNESTSCDIDSIPKRSAYFSIAGTEKCSFRWTIECLSRINAATNTPVMSPLFPIVEDQEKCKWFLTFYPRGDCNEADYLCLKLTCNSSRSGAIMADFVLRLRDSSERELCYRRDEHKFSVNISYTWEQLPRKKHLAEVLEDDILIIDVNITSILQVVNKYHAPESPIPYLRMVDNYTELRKSGRLCDATIIVDTNMIPVHRVVLAARSPVFMAMFENSTKEKESGILEIEDIDYKTMQHLLDFIYSCELPEFEVPLAMDLLKAADKYDLLDLKDHCKNYLATSLNTSNVAEILLLANTYSARELKDRAIEYICMNKSRFSGNVNFINILTEEAAILVDILYRMSIKP